MTTKTQKLARARMARDLQGLQDSLFEDWLANSVPDGWHALASEVDPVRETVELEIDKDMLAWFRRLNPEVSPIVNRILRIYWQGILSGDVRFHWEPEVYGPSHARFLETLARHTLQQLEKSGAPAKDLDELRAVLREMKRVHRKVDPVLDALEAGAVSPKEG